MKLQLAPCSCSWSSKGLQSLITPEMAMKANMMYGGRAKLAMEQMYPALEKGSIYPPSARRLLCIGKAKNVCEVCFNDVENEISNRIIQLREPYCIQACWHCTTSMGMSKCIRKVGPFFQGHRMETNIVLDSSRSCTKRTSWRVVCQSE